MFADEWMSEWVSHHEVSLNSKKSSLLHVQILQYVDIPKLPLLHQIQAFFQGVNAYFYPLHGGASSESSGAVS